MSSATPEIVCVQRQTVDWLSLDDNQFLAQSREFCRLWGKPQDYIYDLYCLWNSTFSMGYLQVRHLLKELARDCLTGVHHLEFVPYQDYKNIPLRDAWYVFVDDDDWLDPDIASSLGKIDPFASPVVLWRSANIGSPNQEHVVFIWGMNGRCMTNNYAIHGSWFTETGKMDQVIQHKDAASLIEGLSNVPHLDCALSVSNKSPISSVSLDRGLDGELEPDRLVAMVADFVRRMDQVQDEALVYIPWSRPLINKTIEIFRAVNESRK
jgi:hypothetical protein